MSDNSQTATTPATLTSIEYAGHTIDFTSLPATSQLAMVRRGITHFLGNEQASKLSGAKAKRAEEMAVPGATAVAFTDAELEAMKTALVAAAVDALRAGTVGVRDVAAPRGTPRDSLIRSLAKAEVLVVLKTAGLAAPTKDKPVKFANGNEFTMDDLIGRRIAAHAERLGKEADAELKARARKAEKLAASIGTDSATADDLGL